MSPHDVDTMETLIYAAYYAPRGRPRLYRVSTALSQRYLAPSDLLIGIIGAEGSGKSTLIRGLFPGLELTNDDEGVNRARAPIYDFDPNDPFSGHTFHIDACHELAFRQHHEVAEAVKEAVAHRRRVVIEHFDLLYPALGYNAQVLFGIGEEIIVARPTVFGPFPENIRAVVHKTIEYRRMAHSAEDITSMLLMLDYHYQPTAFHSDVKHGFVIRFPQEPDIDLRELEAKVADVIRRDVPIRPGGEDLIQIGEWTLPCTGLRTHVKSSGRIENFRLMKHFKHNLIHDEYLLVGMVGHKVSVGFDDINEVLEDEDPS